MVQGVHMAFLGTITGWLHQCSAVLAQFSVQDIVAWRSTHVFVCSVVRDSLVTVVPLYSEWGL